MSLFSNCCKGRRRDQRATTTPTTINVQPIHEVPAQHTDNVTSEQQHESSGISGTAEYTLQPLTSYTSEEQQELSDMPSVAMHTIQSLMNQTSDLVYESAQGPYTDRWAFVLSPQDHPCQIHPTVLRSDEVSQEDFKGSEGVDSQLQGPISIVSKLARTLTPNIQVDQAVQMGFSKGGIHTTMGNMDDPADEPMPWVAIMNRTEVNADCTLDDGARAQWSIGEMNRILSNHAIAMAERGRSRFDKFVTSSSSQKADKEHIHSIFQDTLGSAEVDPRTTESKLKLFLTVFRATGPQNRYKYVFKFSTPGSHRPPNEVSFDQFNKRKIESSDEARFFRSFKTVLGALEILSEPEMSDFQGSYTTRDKFHVKIDSYKSDSFNQPYVGVVMKDGGARVQENTQPAI